MKELIIKCNNFIEYIECIKLKLNNLIHHSNKYCKILFNSNLNDLNIVKNVKITDDDRQLYH